jgi:hypothetical protein
MRLHKRRQCCGLFPLQRFRTNDTLSDAADHTWQPSISRLLSELSGRHTPPETRTYFIMGDSSLETTCRVPLLALAKREESGQDVAGLVWCISIFLFALKVDANACQNVCM